MKNNHLHNRLVNILALTGMLSMLVACGADKYETSGDDFTSTDGSLVSSTPAVSDSESSSSIGNTSSATSASASSIKSSSATSSVRSSSSSIASPVVVTSSSSRSSSSVRSSVSSSVISTSSSSKASTSGVTIGWFVPTARENGDYLELVEIGGYEIRYKLKSQSQYLSVLIDDADADHYSLGFLSGDFEFEIATFDVNGLYSEFVPISPQ